MERVVVFEALSFLGFHLVNKLLNEGIEVIGIDESNSEIKEEMMLSIGRNGNFNLQSKYENKEKVEVMIGCYYNSTNTLNDFRKWENKRIPSLTVRSKEKKIIDVIGKEVLLSEVYGPWYDGELTEIVKEKAIYVDDVVNYLFLLCNQLAEKEEKEVQLITHVSYEQGIEKVQHHIDMFKWLYK